MRGSVVRMKAFWAALAGVLVSCGGGGDVTPQIAVSPNAAGRMCMVPSRCAPAAAKADADANAKKVAARVHPLRAGEQLGGPNATGKVGDWVLENDEVVFVVDALGGGGGFAESGGNLVDAADAHARKDELGQLFTYFGVFPRQALYDALDAHMDPDGTAVLEARGRELYEKDVAVRTEYRLGRADRALLLRTTLENRGTAAVVIPGLGDAVQWGGTEKVAPGKPLGFKGDFKGPFLGGIGRFSSLALTSTEGEIAAVSGNAWSDTTQATNVTLAPGKSTTYERVLVVGERPDLASLVAELVKSSGQPVGRVALSLVDAAGKPVPAPPGAKVVLATSKGDPVMSVVATAASEGVVAGEVPPGKYLASYAPSAGRRALATASVPLEVRVGAIAKATLGVSDAAEVKLGPCVDEGARAIPCKLTVEGRNGAATPDFGPAHVAGPAKNQILLRPGEAFSVPLPPGSYRVTASRGPEYDLAVVDLASPGAEPPPFRLRRVLATPGYVATDFHQHTALSADAPVSTADRVIANAAEGVEVAVASEHNVVADLEPVARELGLAPFFVSIAGDELTSDASRKPWGHANVYPLPVREGARGGAFPVRDRAPKDLFAEARALPGKRVVQVNHPRSGSNGYFDLLGFDAKTATATSPEYASDFDALEVWNGRNVEPRMRVLEDFFGLLRVGKVVTAIADTDTHGIVGQEAGYPRTYVRVKNDGALDAWDGARTDDLVDGVRAARDVVLTNGPFLEVSAKGARGDVVGIGGTATGARVVVDVRVRTAPWVEVEAAELRLASGKEASVVVGPREVALAPKRDAASGAMEAKASFTLAVKEADAFVVIARGKKPMRPVLSGDDAELAPWAMSGAVWLRPR